MTTFELVDGGQANAPKAAPITQDDDALVTIREAAAFLDCHVTSVYRIPFLRERMVKLPGVGARVRRSDLRLFVHLHDRRAG